MNNGIIKRIFVLLVFVLTGMTQGVKAQDVAVKSNVLADAFLNPNLGIEVGLAPKWTLDTGLFSLKSDTGSAIASRDTLWVLTFMADSIISEVLMERSTSLARMLAS